MSTQANGRSAAASIDPMFLERWSPRAFTSQTLTPEQIASLFEAARWSPSSYNEQPWLFMYAATPEALPLYQSLLVPFNQTWANRAPLLSIVFARRTFAKNGKPNRWYAFDCGAAWVSLAFQARKMGLYSHAMAGFDEEAAYEKLGVPKDKFEAMAAIAVGYADDPGTLAPEMAKLEKPNDRKPPTAVAMEGRYRAV